MFLKPAGFKWVKLEVFAGLVLLYVYLWGISGLFVYKNDLDVFFLPQAKMVLEGKLLSVYSYRYQGENCLCPSAHGPLFLIPLSVAAGAASKLNLLGNIALRRVFILASFAPFSFLMSKAAVDIVEYLLERKLEVWKLVLTWVLFLFSPVLWLGIIVYGHIELTMAVWLGLLAMQLIYKRRSSFGAVLFALAILSRSSMLFIFLTMVSFLWVRNGFLEALKFAALCTAVILLFTAPFLLFDRVNFVYSVALYRGFLPTVPSSTWTFLGKWPQITRFLDGVGPATLSFVIPLTIFYKIKNRLKFIDIFGVVTISALFFPLFIRTSVWPYYFLEAYIFGTIFWLGSKKRPRWGFALPVYFTLLALLSMYNAMLVDKFHLFKPVMAILILGMIVLLCYKTIATQESESVRTGSGR